MANAAFGYTNHVLTANLTAGSELPGLNVSNLKLPQGSSATSWQTAGGVRTSAQGAWFVIDAEHEASWHAFLLARTSLTPSAQVRWRVGAKEGVLEETPAIDLNMTDPAKWVAPTGWTFTRADTVNGSSATTATRWNASGDLEAVAPNTMRWDYDPAAPGTLRGIWIEEQRTNSVRNPRGSGGTASTAPTNWTISSPAGITRTLSYGTERGMPFVEIALSGTTTGAGSFDVRFEDGTAITAANGQTWSGSVYATGTVSGLTNLGFMVEEYTSAGAYVTGGSVSVALGSGALPLNRLQHTRTLSGGGTVARVNGFLRWQYASGAVLSGTIRVALPQLEQGNYVTSPIMPPVGTIAAATRGHDIAKLTIGAWWNENEGTAATEWFDPYPSFPNTNNRGFWSAAPTSGTDNRIIAYWVDGGANVRLQAGGASFSFAASFAHTFSGINRHIYAWRTGTNSAVHTSNGATLRYASPTALPASSTLTDQIRIGGINLTTGQLDGHMRRWRYYPKRLTDEQVKSLSSTGSSITSTALTYDSGMVGAGVFPGYGQSVFFAPTPVTGRYCRVDIDDPNNPDNYVAVGLAYAGPVWQPALNMGWGTTTGTDVRIDDVVTRGGQEYPQYRYRQRRWDVSLDHISEGDLWTHTAEVQRAGWAGGNVLFIPDPAGENINREAVFGRVQSLSDFTYSNNSTEFRTWRVRITERL